MCHQGGYAVDSDHFDVAEPNFEDVLLAAAANEATDAAAPESSADTESLLAANFGGDDTVSPDALDAPGEDSPDGVETEEPEDGLEAGADDEAEETEIERLRRLTAEYEQERRETQAHAAEEQSRREWAAKRGKVDDRLREALVWLDAEVKSGRHYDANEFVMRELPTIIEGYTHDLQSYFGEREQAAMQIARQHGTITWVASLEQRFELSKAEVERVKRYPPEFMEQAARDIYDARATAEPVKAELTATRRNLTNTKKALDRVTGKVRRGDEPRPSPVASSASYRDVQARITPDNADEIAGSLFAAIGLNGR
jgi:hypothetical protein